MRLILFRHGRTLANERRLYCGSSDLPLSPAGRDGLRALRGSGALPDIAYAKVITSGMRRCEETAPSPMGRTRIFGRWTSGILSCAPMRS